MTRWRGRILRGTLENADDGTLLIAMARWLLPLLLFGGVALLGLLLGNWRR